MAEGTIAFIGDADSVLGFRALGVRTVVPESPARASKEFAELVRREVSVIMVTEDMAENLAEQIETTAHMTVPAVVVLPGVTGRRERGRETIRRLITRAVGVDLMGESAQQ
ncbi:V-type ATP synthase subunit F [Candidatus Fermentibacteria bacterium]|nr:V-type ATP synthase subunit F [Candidatus Fermentibacteria bacterium]